MVHSNNYEFKLLVCITLKLVYIKLNTLQYQYYEYIPVPGSIQWMLYITKLYC